MTIKPFVVAGIATAAALATHAFPAPPPIVWTAEGNQTSAGLGADVASAGDVNGDGYGDVIVGAPIHGFPFSKGRAMVYHGSSTGLATMPAWTAEGWEPVVFWPVYFGRAVASAGDVNGDGYGDVIVGAPEYDNDQITEGAAFVYLGSATGLGQQPAWQAEGNHEGARFGSSVASAGDVNGDGYGDVIVGAPFHKKGRVWVYLGSAAGLSDRPAWRAAGDGSTDGFGSSVASAGDVDGDGYADLIVGTDDFFGGRIFVYRGSPTGPLQPPWRAGISGPSGFFGHAVNSAGDVNGDGYSDVIVGEYWFGQGTQFHKGRALVYHGSSAGLEPKPSWIAVGASVEQGFGFDVSTAGDVNGDGYSDVVVGALYIPDFAQGTAGLVRVYLGSPSGLAAAPAWERGGQPASFFGSAVSTAGDVDGDGYDEVIVGAPGYDNGHQDEGAAFAYAGSPP